MTNMRQAAAFLVVASLWTGCSKSVTAPTSVTSGPVQLLRLSVTGNSSFAAIGESSQLAVAATFTDGTVKDVSSGTNWQSADASVVTVSSTGLLTVVGLGKTVISAHYQNLIANRSATATAPGTYVLSGSVQEPGQGGLANVRVIDTASLTSTQTGLAGRYTFASFPSSQAHLRFEKDGYEPVELDATSDVVADIRMQQMIHLVAGETVAPHRLAPNDLTYAVGAGQRCNSCRLVRLVVPVKSTVHVRLTWPSDCVVTLGLWVGGSHIIPSSTGSTEVDADVTSGPGEMIFYVDRASPSATICHVAFVLATSLAE